MVVNARDAARYDIRIIYGMVANVPNVVRLKMKITLGKSTIAMYVKNAVRLEATDILGTVANVLNAVKLKMKIIPGRVVNAQGVASYEMNSIIGLAIIVQYAGK
jgi:hypothetical protein